MPKLIRHLWPKEVWSTVSPLLELRYYIWSISTMMSVVHSIHLTHTGRHTWFIIWIWCVNLNCLVELKSTGSTTKALSEVFVSDISVNFISTRSTERFMPAFLFDAFQSLVSRWISWMDHRHHCFFIVGSYMIFMRVILSRAWTQRLNIWVLFLSSKGIFRFLSFTDSLAWIEIILYSGVLCRPRSSKLTVKTTCHSNFLHSKIH